MSYDTRPVTLYHIPVEPPLKRIYTRLGYRKSKTLISEREQQKIRKIIDNGIVYCQLAGIYARIPIAEGDEQRVTLKNGIAWDSRNMANFLSASTEVFIMAATAGSEIVEQRDHCLQRDKTLQAVILDALASEVVESAIQWIHDYLRNLITQEGKRVTKRRYSPGYGDFALENQRDIFSCLHMEALDLQLTDHSILIPEKSVTAIVGIE
ncbi:methionine synthase [candidate division KSB3 bacterium]|uniref:Methionine synthase n=1 Tax=candidate division KSB3 bacterium TaxID=2044937 RepID=A0A2G6KLA6_9BACT|nr:MAG: methionine synthase [candidate division KSB3 bacterium]